MCNEFSLQNIVEQADKINLYRNSVVSVYADGDDGFDEIIIGWKEMTASAHDMPAYGVSLNNETLKALESGVWIEFEFLSELKINEMPFEKLLIKVEREYQGFNIIRYNTQYGYDGRCFYLDLINNKMANFYDLLCNL